MARHFGLKPVTPLRPNGAQSKMNSSSRLVAGPKQSAGLPKPLYAPASWRGSLDRRSSSGAY